MSPRPAPQRGHVLFATCATAVCALLVLGLAAPHMASHLISVEIKMMPAILGERVTTNQRRIWLKEKQFRRHQALFAVKNLSMRSHAHNKCLSIFSLGDARPEMSSLTLQTLHYLRALKGPSRQHAFLRQEAYSVLSLDFPRVQPTQINASEPSKSTSWRGRLQQLDGQLPHLPCKLRSYSAAQLKQCVASRRRRGQTTKVLFVGDSRVRQLVEVFLDVFRELKFRIATFEGLVVGVEDFFSEDVDFLWTKYKREFEASSDDAAGLRVGFYWTSLMGVKTKLSLLQPHQNPQVFSAAEDRFMHKLRQQSALNSTKKPEAASSSQPDARQPHHTNAVTSHTGTDSEGDSQIESIATLPPEVTGKAKSIQEDHKKSKIFKSEPLLRLQNITRMAKEEIPDIVILGTGIWSLDHRHGFLKVLDDVSLEQLAELRPLLGEVARRTDVVWLMAPPISDNVFLQPIERTLRSYMFNKYQDWISSAQTHAFINAGIPVWDSLQPVAYASIADCAAAHLAGQLPEHPALRHRRPWDCGDRVHTNNEAVVVAVQMLVNYLCNEHLPPHNFCCHQTS